jgi:hypothetical protein
VSTARPVRLRAAWVRVARAVGGYSRRLCRGEDGFAGGAEGLIFGLLLFVVGTLIVAAAWGVVDTKTATDTSAADAARSYVAADNAAAAASAASAAADTALSGFGRSPSRGSVTLASGTFGRCQRITIRVSYPAPLIDLPFVGRVGSGLGVSSQVSELVDPYRSGLPGSATC